MSKRIAICLHNLAGGGAERVAVTMANEFAARGYPIDLVLVEKTGPYLEQVSANVRVHSLHAVRTFAGIRSLSRWLTEASPDVVISHLTHMNVATLMASGLAHSAAPVVCVEHNQMDLNYARLKQYSARAAYRLSGLAYRRAARVVCVSQGVADSVARFSHTPSRRIIVLPNPVIDETTMARLQSPAQHHWLTKHRECPTFTACGRLVEQKGFGTLLRALRIVRDVKMVRLVVLGEGELRPELEQLARDLGVNTDVDFAGFRSDALQCIAASDAFVLSSNWEGMPTVLIEALASGAPVVATDCPSGPRELLRGGILGPLVKMRDPPALARAMLSVLDRPGDASARREGVAQFRADRSAQAYLGLVDELTRARHA